MKKHWRVLGTLPVRIPKRGHTIGTFGTMWMRMDLKMLWQQGWYDLFGFLDKKLFFSTRLALVLFNNRMVFVVEYIDI